MLTVNEIRGFVVGTVIDQCKVHINNKNMCAQAVALQHFELIPERINVPNIMRAA